MRLSKAQLRKIQRTQGLSNLEMNRYRYSKNPAIRAGRALVRGGSAISRSKYARAALVGGLAAYGLRSSRTLIRYSADGARSAVQFATGHGAAGTLPAGARKMGTNLSRAVSLMSFIGAGAAAYAAGYRIRQTGRILAGRRGRWGLDKPKGRSAFSKGHEFFGNQYVKLSRSVRRSARRTLRSMPFRRGRR